MYGPGGRRTSLSLKACKSAASLDELRGVLSLAVCKSAVWVLESEVVKRVQIDPGTKSKAAFSLRSSAAGKLNKTFIVPLDWRGVL